MKKLKLSAILNKISPYLKKERKSFFVILLCAVFVNSLNIVTPIILRYIMEKSIYNIYSLNISMITYIGLLYILMLITNILASFYVNYKGNMIGTKIESNMREDLFKHLQELSHSFYNDNEIAKLISYFTNDLTSISSFLHRAPEQLLISIFTIIIILVIFTKINIILTLISLVTLPIFFVVIKYLNKKIRYIMKKQRVQVGEMNAEIENALAGIYVTKTFTNESFEIKKFNKQNKKFCNIKSNLVFYLSINQSFVQFFGWLIYIINIVIGMILVRIGQINIGDFTAYILYTNTLFSAIREIVMFLTNFQYGITGLERFCEILNIKPEIMETKNAKDFNQEFKNLEFKNISFKYNKSNNIFNGLNLQISKGEKIAFIGESGIGKTTLINLIPRFYDVNAGQILINNTDITNYTLKSIRNIIGIIQQDVYLFSGTIFENIEYGKIGASRNDVIKSAKLAGAHEFITQLENGYDTYVGERGVKLSGGQKQRISIARVFLKNPQILILDEATSALDYKNEELIQSSLEKLSKGRTVIMITHRLNSIKNANKIILFSEHGVKEIKNIRDMGDNK